MLKNLEVTKNNAAVTAQVVDIAKSIEGAVQKNLAITQGSAEQVKLMHASMTATFEVWGKMFEERLRQLYELRAP